MEGSAFLSLATIQLPLPARLLLSSWCPDKDLLVIVTRLGGKDRLSLWKMQGSKIWEVGFDSDSTSSGDDIVSINWSPDGQTIAVAHDPPRITLHSIQDGHQERLLPISTISPPVGVMRTTRLTGVWWLMQKKQDGTNRIPDIFKRGNDVTGSAHSVLKGQPLLDPLQDDSQPLTATDLFAFQGPHPRTVTSSLPPVISSWPTLPTDTFAASIQPSKLGGNQLRPGEDLDEVDDANVDSVLLVSDDAGFLHCFLDGSYPLGSIRIGLNLSITSLHKEDEVIFVHPRFMNDGTPALASLRPSIIHVPELKRRTVRDVARTSSSVRELTWYAMRVVKDMRAAWFGSDTESGARELGPKWVRALEARQKDEFGQDEPYAMLDLVSLLTTGRISDALADYLGSGERMSERGLQKWESTIVEALTKLRDCSEKKLAPACQRIVVLLEEVKGWSQLSQYETCAIETAQINACLDLASRAITVAAWLAAMTRRELVRFKEFMIWLKYETARANTSPDAPSLPPPKHDILEVNDYLMSGLVVSPIDKWFLGPVPQFSTHDLGVPGDQHDLRTVMQRARGAVRDHQQIAWQFNIQHKDLSHLDRNLDSLIQELATRCQRIFVEAAGATARSAVVVSGPTPAQVQDTTLLHEVESKPLPLIRERTVMDNSQANTFVQYLAMQAPRDENQSYLCLARMRYGRQDVELPLHVSIAVLECCVAGNEANETRVPFDLLDADFFDENILLLVYRIEDGHGPASIATVGYSDLIYEDIELQTYVNDFAREGLMLEVLRRLKDGRLTSVPAPIVQSRNLTGCKEGTAFLAVNGRVGRRVACVLDGPGLALEILDIEGEEELEEMSTVEA